MGIDQRTSSHGETEGVRHSGRYAPRMSETHDVVTADGRILRVHDSGELPAGAGTVVWHTGSPQTGALLTPVLEACAARGLRLVSYGRPGYGGSTANLRRNVASAAPDVEAIVDALGIRHFFSVGASGGGPHALACAALLPDRVTGVATLAGIAPFTDEYDWFAGMQAPSALRAALVSPEAREEFAKVDDFDPECFLPVDYDTLREEWASLGEDSGRAGAAGSRGLIDDDVAFVAPWGFDLGRVTAPAIVAQGGLDRVVPASHGIWLHDHVPGSEFWERPDAGHISILRLLPEVLDRLVEWA
ncbi:alpha/beta hydrolase [Frondihabitans peucedani]|uniref:Alpha/beta hydrolase n=2 Tax=Frondihabitans peucedani TaxID=598626 RepID=A0ABP8E5V6_9MICO